MSEVIEQEAKSAAGHAQKYTRNNPYMSYVRVNYLLTGEGSEKETRHVELTLEEGSAAAEAARLAQLLGMQGSLVELNRALAGKIAGGELDLLTPGLSEHLWQTTMDKLAVDQPNYASYKRELGNKGS